MQLKAIGFLSVGAVLPSKATSARAACYRRRAIFSFVGLAVAVFVLAAVPSCCWAAQGDASSPPATGSLTGTATNKTYDNPFAYCRAVRNAQYREGNGFPGYTGPQNPPSVVAALGFGTPVAFRCANGVVYGCFMGASGAACLQQTISVRPDHEMLQFCQEHPNSGYLPMSLIAGWASDWKCDGTKPVVTRTNSTDAQGYLANTWHRIRPPSGSSKH